jgi:hypothetical protein
MELLNKIKVLMHDPMRVKHPFASLTEAMIRMLNAKQVANEGLMDHAKRFKLSHDITKSHVGTDMLDKFVENTRKHQDETDDTEMKEMKDGAFTEWLACLLIQNSDQSKHGSSLDGLISQFSMNNDQCPETIRIAMDCMAPHEHNLRWNQGNRGTQRSRS